MASRDCKATGVPPCNKTRKKRKNAAAKNPKNHHQTPPPGPGTPPGTAEPVADVGDYRDRLKRAALQRTREEDMSESTKQRPTSFRKLAEQVQVGEKAIRRAVVDVRNENLGAIGRAGNPGYLSPKSLVSLAEHIQLYELSLMPLRLAGIAALAARLHEAETGKKVSISKRLALELVKRAGASLRRPRTVESVHAATAQNKSRMLGHANVRSRIFFPHYSADHRSSGHRSNP
jgi:hypothetical protein